MASTEQLGRLHAVIPAAQAAQRKWGVPASITLAQWILESGWGSSELAVKAQNYFGVKATHLDVPESYVEFPTAEYVAGKRVLVHAMFEKYFDAADSFEEHARLLANATRYRSAMAASEAPERMAFCLQSAGYSTNPQYAQLLIDLISQHDLLQYDELPPEDPAHAQEAAAA